MELACLDGRIAPAAETFVPATDEGLLRGDGVFEVVRVYGGTPFALAEHLERMAASARNLRLGHAVDAARFAEEAAALLAERGAGWDGCLRLVLTRGGRRLLLTEPLPEPAPSVRLGPVTYAPPRVLDGVKSLSYAANMLAGRIAREQGFDEALLVSPHGRVLEAPTATFFWVDGDGVVSTPPLAEHILASITRRVVLEACPVREAPVALDDVLAGASEAFLASTTREVQPVAAIGARELPAPGPRTREVAAEVAARIRAAVEGAAP